MILFFDVIGFPVNPISEFDNAISATRKYSSTSTLKCRDFEMHIMPV